MDANTRKEYLAGLEAQYNELLAAAQAARQRVAGEEDSLQLQRRADELVELLAQLRTICERE